MLDRAWIAAHIPHQGNMCLLDAVESWSAERICCRSATHRDPANPLRAGGRLGALTGIEYAAQAMAIHGALASGGTPAGVGMLGSARGVECLVARLDDIATDLLVDAECLSADERALLYAFTVSAAGRPLLRGRASVVLGALPIPSTDSRS